MCLKMSSRTTSERRVVWYQRELEVSPRGDWAAKTLEWYCREPSQLGQGPRHDGSPSTAHGNPSLEEDRVGHETMRHE